MAIPEIQNLNSANHQPITDYFDLLKKHIKSRVWYQQNSDVVDDVIDYGVSSISCNKLFK